MTAPPVKDHAALRARIRDLIAGDALPAADDRRWHLRVAGRADTACLVCQEPGPQVTYVRAGGRNAALHAACNALRLIALEATP